MEQSNNTDMLSSDSLEILLQEQIVRPEQTSVLRLLNKGLPIAVPKLKGKYIIDNKIFIFHDKEKTNYERRLGPQKASPACRVYIYCLDKDTTLKEAFESFEVDLDDLCFTPNQMAFVCKNKWLWLNSFSKPTFFLIKENGEFYVSAVYFQMMDHMLKLSVSYRVEFYELSDAKIWLANSQCCLVVK